MVDALLHQTLRVGGSSALAARAVPLLEAVQGGRARCPLAHLPAPLVGALQCSPAHVQRQSRARCTLHDCCIAFRKRHLQRVGLQWLNTSAQQTLTRACKRMQTGATAFVRDPWELHSRDAYEPTADFQRTVLLLPGRRTRNAGEGAL